MVLLALVAFLSGCSGNISEAPISRPVDETQASTREERSLQREKTPLQSMVDLGFEAAKKSARIDFNLATLDGSPRTLKDYEGDFILLNFWATWCAPCRIEMPALERLHQNLSDHGLRIVGVNLGEEIPLIQDFIKNTHITFEVVVDHDLSTGRLYAARSLPMTYVIDRAGTIVARAIGVRDWDSDLMLDMFAKLIDGSSGS